MSEPPPETSRTSAPSFTHLDAEGAARMVDVGAKPVQQRRALARGRLTCQPATLQALKERRLPKGDVLAVAHVAGIQAAKRASDLIPLCHPLPIEEVRIVFEVGTDHILIDCAVATNAKTGVEMEALTGVSVAALTLYDMCKSADKSMRIDGIHLARKSKR